MKKYRNTIALAIATIAVLIFAILEYKESQESAVPEGKVRFFSNIEVAKIDKLILSDNEINEQTRLEKSNNQWQLTSPLQDKGSFNEIESYISKLKVTDLSQLDVEGLKIDNEKFGFKDPLFEIEVNYKGKKGLNNFKKLVFSKVKTYDNKFFVKTDANGKKNIYLAEEQVFKDLRKDTNHFRNKELFPIKDKEIQSVIIDYSGKKQDVEIVRGDPDWKIESLEGIEVAYHKVENFISSLNHIKMDSIYKNDFTNKDLTQVGLNKPLATIKVKWSDSEWWLKVSEPENDIHHVIVKDNKTIYRVKNELFKKFLVENQDFRNRVYPFNFNVSLVDYIVIKTENMKNNERYLLKDKWSDYDENPHRQVNDGKIKNFLTSLTQLKVNLFKTKKNLNLKNQVSLESKKDMKTVFTMSWGESFEFDDSKYYYVKTSLEPVPFAVKVEEVDKLFKEKFYSDNKPAEQGQNTTERDANSQK